MSRLQAEKSAPIAEDVYFENERAHASRASFRLKAGLRTAYPTKVLFRDFANGRKVGGVMKNNILSKIIVTLAITACTARAAFPAGADTFANAGIIPTANQNDYSADTNIAAFTAQAGEPDNGEGRSAWWRWTALADGWCTIDTLRSNEASPGVEDSILAVYTGAAVNSLTLVAENDDRVVPENYLSQVTFYATAGTTYSASVDSFGTGAGVVLRHRFLRPAKCDASARGTPSPATALAVWWIFPSPRRGLSPGRSAWAQNSTHSNPPSLRLATSKPSSRGRR